MTAFSHINEFTQLKITSGSIIITLENSQRVRLLNLVPSDISNSNFIFSPPKDSQWVLNAVIYTLSISCSLLGIMYLYDKYYIEPQYKSILPISNDDRYENIQLLQPVKSSRRGSYRFKKQPNDDDLNLESTLKVDSLVQDSSINELSDEQASHGSSYFYISDDESDQEDSSIISLSSNKNRLFDINSENTEELINILTNKNILDDDSSIASLNYHEVENCDINSKNTEELINKIMNSDQFDTRSWDGFDSYQAEVSTNNDIDNYQNDEANEQYAVTSNSKVLLSIDAMIYPEHVNLQGNAFLELSKQLAYITRETMDSYNKIFAIENGIPYSNNFDYSFAALATQQILERASTIRYLFGLLGIDLPQINLPNGAWAGVHFAIAVVKTSGNGFLWPAIQSGSYYARLELYDVLAKQSTDEQLTDLVSFIKACGKHIVISGTLGLASGAPIYGAINGAAICLNQHQMLKESTEQTMARYAVDILAGVIAVYGLTNQDIPTQVIGVVSSVSISDIAIRVGIPTATLGLNGVSELQGEGDYA